MRKGWRKFPGDNLSTFIDMPGVCRVVVRKTPNRWALRMNGEHVGGYDTEAEAHAEGEVRAKAAAKGKAELDAWYAETFGPENTAKVALLPIERKG